MKFFRRPAQPHPPAVQIAPPKPKTLNDLEREMVLEAQVIATQVNPAPLAGVRQTLQRGLKRLIWTGLVLGLPVGAIALVNLPYSPIQRPVAQAAPILLTPSYIRLDQNFRQASANLEAAKQLIDRATAPADLELGEQRLNQAQANLDQLPTWVWNESPNTLPNTEGWWWYSWRFSRLGLNQARAEVGRLQGKLLQEKNAQTTLNQAERALNLGRQQYQQAKTPLEQQIALQAWQAGLDQLRQVPPQTLAAQMAHSRIATAQRDLKAVGGLVSGNQESLNLIRAAKQFSWQAAQASQHPPHTVTEWQQVLDLRQQAMQRLEQVSPQDTVGYAEAQRLLAEYQRQQGQIKVRQDSEAQAVANFKQAQAQINSLIAKTPRGIVNRSALSQLQQIILQLQTIDSGTTVYPEAQKLLISAQQKLKDWQSERPGAT